MRAFITKFSSRKLSLDKTKIALFADDIAIYTESSHPRIAAEIIKNHINLLADYNRKWKIKVNAVKSNVTILNNRKKQTNNVTLLREHTNTHHATSQIYLGVPISNKLKLNKHIQNICYTIEDKQYLKPYINNNSILITNLKKQLIRAYLRSTLTYAARVWSFTAKTNIDRLDVLGKLLHKQ